MRLLAPRPPPPPSPHPVPHPHHHRIDAGTAGRGRPAMFTAVYKRGTEEGENTEGDCSWAAAATLCIRVPLQKVTACERSAARADHRADGTETTEQETHGSGQRCRTRQRRAARYCGHWSGSVVQILTAQYKNLKTNQMPAGVDGAAHPLWTVPAVFMPAGLSAHGPRNPKGRGSAFKPWPCFHGAAVIPRPTDPLALRTCTASAALSAPLPVLGWEAARTGDRHLWWRWKRQWIRWLLLPW